MAPQPAAVEPAAGTGSWRNVEVTWDVAARVDWRRPTMGTVGPCCRLNRWMRAIVVARMGVASFQEGYVGD